MNSWILLRGLLRETRHWGDFPARLQAALPGDRVVAIDLPGNGEHYRLRSPLRVAEMVQFCRAQLALHGEPGPFSLLALSLGGMVACDWARSTGARWMDPIQAFIMVSQPGFPANPSCVIPPCPDPSPREGNGATLAAHDCQKLNRRPQGLCRW